MPQESGLPQRNRGMGTLVVFVELVVVFRGGGGEFHFQGPLADTLAHDQAFFPTAVKPRVRTLNMGSLEVF